MTENNDIQVVHKITGDRVEIGLNEFIEMVNEIRAAKETAEANVWLQNARKKLMDELQYTRENVTPKAPTSIVVYRRSVNGSLIVQFIEAMQQGGDGTVYVTVGDPS